MPCPVKLESRGWNEDPKNPLKGGFFFFGLDGARWRLQWEKRGRVRCQNRAALRLREPTVFQWE